MQVSQPSKYSEIKQGGRPHFPLKVFQIQCCSKSVIREIATDARAVFPHDKTGRLKSPSLATMTLMKHTPSEMNWLYEVHDINLFLVYNVCLNRRQTLRLNGHCPLAERCPLQPYHQKHRAKIELLFSRILEKAWTSHVKSQETSLVLSNLDCWLISTTPVPHGAKLPCMLIGFYHL